MERVEGPYLCTKDSMKPRFSEFSNGVTYFAVNDLDSHCIRYLLVVK